VIELFIGTLAAFLISGAALMLGQWFGRPPIEGRCVPRGSDGCGLPDCCRLREEQPRR
jgi:hypothetical protein